MLALRACLCVMCGAVAGYFLAGLLAVGVLLASGIDEDDEDFQKATVGVGAISVLAGGYLGWRFWRRRSRG